MDEIIRILMSMGKTKEEALEFVGKEMPKGGVDNVASNVLKPITKKVAGDFPLIGSRITDPTQTGQFGRHNIQVLNTMDRYPLIRQSIEDQKLNWQKTLEFIREGGYSLSALQKQNLNFNLGVLQRSKIVLKDIEKGLTSEGQNVEKIYQEFVRNKRFLGNESTGLSSEGNEILDFIEETRGKGEDLTKTTKNQEQILKDQKAANDKRMKRLYEGRAYEGDVGMYRTLGGYHLPKLHEAGIINLDPKIYEAIKAGRYHHGGAEFFAPDPNRVLQYHFGSKIFDDLDKAIEEAALKGGDIALKGPNGMIDFLKKNDYLPFKKDGPANAIDYLKPDELLERVKEIEASSEVIKKGNSPFFKTPDEIMNRVMVNANEKKLYLESFKRTHPEKYKLYEKTQSEEPFFALGDVGQGDVFSDLADITTPKDKGDLLPFPKKKKTKIKEEETVPVKPGQGKFTKAEYLIQRLENTLKDPNADPYVRKTFPGFIDELKADPDLAKNENVFKELGGDLPEDQQIVVYDDDTLDFFTQKEGPGNIKTLDKLLEDNPFLSREEGLNLLKMEPNDQVMELTKLKFLNKKKTDNAEGGIIKLAEGGRINYQDGTDKPFDPFGAFSYIESQDTDYIPDEARPETGGASGYGSNFRHAANTALLKNKISNKIATNTGSNIIDSLTRKIGDFTGGITSFGGGLLHEMNAESPIFNDNRTYDNAGNSIGQILDYGEIPETKELLNPEFKEDVVANLLGSYYGKTGDSDFNIVNNISTKLAEDNMLTSILDKQAKDAKENYLSKEEEMRSMFSMEPNNMFLKNRGFETANQLLQKSKFEERMPINRLEFAKKLEQLKAFNRDKNKASSQALARVKQRKEIAVIQKRLDEDKRTARLARDQREQIQNLQNRINAAEFNRRGNSSDRNVGGGSQLSGKSATSRGKNTSQGYTQHAQGGIIGLRR